jgi:hypothetical protein
LFERFIDAYKNFLRQIFRRFDARCKPVGKIKNPARVKRYDLFPRSPVSGAATSYEFRSTIADFNSF